MKTTDPIRILISWANAQSHWVREIVSIVVENRHALTEHEVQIIVAHCLVEEGLQSGKNNEIPHICPPLEVGPTGVHLQLDSLHDVQYVNRLAPNQEIKFNPHLTIVYGENASGKSGYVRILKQIAAVRSVESILPDVTQTNRPSTPHAILEFKLDENDDQLEWNGEKGLSPLDRISVFDTRSSDIHLTERLEFAYTPNSLALFPYVNEAITLVQNSIKSDVSELNNPVPHIEYSFQMESEIQLAISNLSVNTDLKRLQSLARLSDSELTQLGHLQQQMDALNSTRSTSDIEVAKTDLTLYELLHSTAAIVFDCDWDSYDASRKRIETVEQERALVAQVVAPESITSDDARRRWDDFIIAGGAYLKEIGRDDYPETNDVCIYCHQHLGTEAFQLIQRYQQYLVDPIQDELNSAKTELDQTVSPVKNIDVNTLSNRFDAKNTTSERSQSKILVVGLDFAKRVSCLIKHLNSQSKVNSNEITQISKAVKCLAQNEIESTKKLIELLQATDKTRSGELESVKAELLPFTDRQELKRVLNEIVEYVLTLQWKRRAEAAIQKMSNIGRSLTLRSKTASEALLNHAFLEYFSEECDALNAPAVSIQFPGRRGITERRKSVAEAHQLDAVLSEGEQKVISLADFIAELRIQHGSSPVLFDDPVNSLDYRRMERIAVRLRTLADQHQVIVFTHNIWFATSLVTLFEDSTDKCSFFNIGVHDNGSTGLITGGTHPRTDTVRSLRGRINASIQNATSSEGQDRSDHIYRAYSHLRAWCETVTEHELLGGVSIRYRSNVMMGGLGKIKFEKLASTAKVINELFEKSSGLIYGHSQPSETLNVSPTLEQLQSDWVSAQATRDAYNRND